MSKRILVLTGSPRKGGNSEMMADALIKGARGAGHETDKIECAFLEVKGCRACDQCWTNGKPCIFEDDFNRLAPQLERADVLALVFPLYWFTMPSAIKAYIDKFYAYMSQRAPRKLKIKEAVLLVCGGGAGADFDGARQTYKSICDYMGWKSAGELVVEEVQDMGDVKKTQALENAARLGRTL